MGLTIATQGIANPYVTCRACTFDSSYPLGGETLTPANLGWEATSLVQVNPAGDYRFDYVVSTQKLRAFWNKLGVAQSTIAIDDDDNAASAGVAVYVHIDEVTQQGAFLAHLEAVTAGNADALHQTGNGSGVYVRIQDDDNAASGGFALYIDEDATEGKRFLADLDNIADQDVFVPLSDGTLLRIEDIDDGTGGVQVYVDDDAANTYERLKFVSPTNANGSCRLWTYGGEVPEATNLSAVTATVFAHGFDPA